MKHVKTLTLILFTILLVGSVCAELQTNFKDPGLTQEEWVYYQEPSCNNNPDGGNALWALIGVEVDGTPCSREVTSIDWENLPDNKKAATLVIDNTNNLLKCSSMHNYFGIQAYPYTGGYKDLLYFDQLEKFVVRVKIRNNELTFACDTPDCSICPYGEDFLGRNFGGWAAIMIGIPLYDNVLGKNLWLEMVVYGTDLADCHDHPKLNLPEHFLLGGTNVNEEMWRLFVTHPLINKPLIAPGEEYYYEIDVLPVIKGIPFDGRSYTWSKVHMGNAYIGTEIWGDARASWTVSDFDVLYELKPGEDLFSPKGYHDPAANDCQVIGWTCDQDNYGQPLTVKFYDGTTLIGETTANQNRESGVGDQCGGNSNRGFFYSFPESVLHDGQPHQITVKAVGINQDGIESTEEYSLTQTPRAVTCPVVDYGDSLYIRTSKSYLQTPDSYILYVVDNKETAHGYNGYLEAQATSCDANGNNCATTTFPWRDSNGNDIEVIGGSVNVDIPSSFINPSVITAKFRPNPNTYNLDWSNEIQVNIDSTYGLIDSKDYWITPNREYMFYGKNYPYNKNFETLVGWNDNDICGESGTTWYFMKDIPEAYWNPKRPGETWAFEQNLEWYIMDWQKKSGWHDEYLYGKGHQLFNYNPNDPFDVTENFKDSRRWSQSLYDSVNPMFAPYTLVAHWVGSGWGIGNLHNNTICFDYSDCFENNYCDLELGLQLVNHQWIVHSDIVNIRLPDDTSLPVKYQGPALRMKYYEGNPGFITDDTKYGLREDWFFIKDQGLVKIEQKWFSPNNQVPCSQDDDCFFNEVMENPHIRLTREDYHCYDEGDVNHDCNNDLQDLSFVINNFGTQGYSNIDANRDNRVNLFDLVLVAKNMI